MSTAPRGMAMLYSLEMQTLTGDGRTVAAPCDHRASAGGAASVEGELGFGHLPLL